MIKRLLRRVLRLGAKSDHDVIPKSRHGIGRERLSNGARKVCDTLQGAGHQAYVVGGAVRDLLIGVRPKDYDVATNASPEEVHRLFRRSRLIGRRFKLAHVMFGDETVEVSTFRAGNSDASPDESDAGKKVSATPEHRSRRGSGDPVRSGAMENARLVDEHGRVLRDNVYGTREQDAARRDFTLNALYYDPSSETVLDFHNGMRDIKRRTVRIIGDPEARFREDPVRMLRAARFAAKLDFTIEARTREPISKLAKLISNVPPARVFDEMLKLLLSGHAASAVRQLRDDGLHHGLLPMLDVILEQPLGKKFVNLALEQTDERVRVGKPVSPAFLFATLLWHEVLAGWKSAEKSGLKPIPALHRAMDEVLDAQTDKLAIPKRFTAVMKEIWALQPRFEARSGKRPYALLANERYRAAYDFLLLRSESGEISPDLAKWWTEFAVAGAEDQHRMLLSPSPGQTRPRRRRKRSGRSDGGAPQTGHSPE